MTKLATNDGKATRVLYPSISKPSTDSSSKTFAEVPGKLKPAKYSCIPVLQGTVKKTGNVNVNASESKESGHLTREGSKKTKLVFPKYRPPASPNPTGAAEIKSDAKKTKGLPLKNKINEIKENASDSISFKEVECSNLELHSSSVFKPKSLQRVMSPRSAMPIDSSSSFQFSEKGKLEENMIRDLYETFKNAGESLLDKVGGKPVKTPSKKLVKQEGESEHPKVQELYETMIRDIHEVWTNTARLLEDVREHTFKYVEEKSGEVGRQQLIFEADMLQLAVDFAVSYSKGKTDILLKDVTKKRPKGESGELEDFMNSKIFYSLYNENDLNSMANTIKNFSVTVHKDLE